MKNISFSLAALLLCVVLGNSAYSQVKFNEIQPSNSKTQLDPDFYKYRDWVELYNTSSSTIDLSGYYITDNKDKPRKWQIPAGKSIASKAFLLIYCDGEDVTGKAMHTNFKISEGDVLYLYSSTMRLMDSVHIGNIETDYTYGRLVNGTGAWGALSKPTPGASNVSTTVKGLAPKPVFSIKGGYFNKEQNITLSTTLPGAVIRYTTDGSEPTANSPIYEGAITAKSTTKTTQKAGYDRKDKTGIQHYSYPSSLSYPSSKYTGTRTYGFVLKAKVFHDDYVPSETEGNTYFININARSLPVVAVSTDFANFFDADSGIYIQGTNGAYDGYVTANWRQDWERKVYVEYFDASGNRQFGVSAGASTMGAVSRNYDMKSLNIVMKKKYEAGEINYPLFGEDGLSSYKSFVLRNAGNDWEQGSKYRDAAIQQVLRGQIDLETQDFEPVVMYLNGEYWGLINMRERFDEDYFAGYHDYADDIDLLKFADDSTYDFRASKGTTERLAEMMIYLANNSLSDKANYEFVKSHYIDVDNAINYYIAQLYCQNTDWPANNMRMWRQRSENGKFRFPWYDADFGYGLWGGDAHTNPWDNFDKSSYVKKTSVAILNYLLKNDEFKAEFVQRFYAMMATLYDPERFITITDNIEHKLSMERTALMDEWTCTLNAGDCYGYGVCAMQSWATKRVGYMKGYVDSKFGSNGTTTLNIKYSSSQGQVYVCSIPVSNGYSATHQKNRAIRLTAEPKDGYVFSAWKNGTTTVSTEPEYFATIESTTTLTAEFVTRSTEKNLYINEFLASNSTDITSESLKHEDWIEIYNGGKSDVNLAGLYLSDNLQNLTKYHIPYGESEKTTIKAGGFLLFWADKEPQDGVLHLPFKLDRSNGSIYLAQKSASGSISIIDSIHYEQQNTDVSYGRFPDGNSNLIIFTKTTPNASNTILSDSFIDGLVINEFMSKNTTTVQEETGTYADWFEIYNTTSKDIDLGGLFVTNDLNNLNKYMIPKGQSELTTIKAGGYYVFWCDKQTAINPNHVDFKLPAAAGDIAIVQLRGSENYIIDKVSYSNQGEDISFGRYPTVSSDFRYLLTPTPNAKNANNVTVKPVAGITINEVLALNTSIVADDQGNYSDYIEFYNGSSSAIDLGGLFISDSTGYPLRCRIPTSNPALTTVQSGKWIAFWADGKPELGANHLDFSLSGAGESVVLSQIGADGNITTIDEVTFGVQTENISYGRYPETNDNWEEMSPTYASKNQSVNSSVALKTLTSSVGVITPSLSTSVLSYECVLPAGTTEVPTISATTVHEKASATVTQAESLDGNAVVKVISANGFNSEIYKVTFKIAASSDATLATLTLGGGTLQPSFSPNVYSYKAMLNTTYVPYLTAIAADKNAKVDIDYAETVSEATVITVTAEDGSSKQYEITYSAASSQNIVSEWSDDFTNGIDNVSIVTNQYKVSLQNISTPGGFGQPATSNKKLGVSLEQTGKETEFGYIEYHLPTGYVLDGTSSLYVSMDVVGVANGETLNDVTVDNEYISFNVALVDIYGNVSDYLTPATTLNSSTTGTTTFNYASASYITKSAIVAVRIALSGPSDSKKARNKAAYIDNLVIGPKTSTGNSEAVALSSNADMKSLSVNVGTLSPAFSQDVHSYVVTLPAGTDEIPVVSAVAKDASAYLEVSQASQIDGTAYVKVISQDMTNMNEYAIQYVVTPASVTGYTDYVVRPAMKGWSESSPLYEMTYNGGDIVVAYNRTTTASDAIQYNIVNEDYKILDLQDNPYVSIKLKTNVATSLFVELFDSKGNKTAATVAAADCQAGAEYVTYTFDFTNKFATADASKIYGMNLYFDKGSAVKASGAITIDELRFGGDVELSINKAPIWSEIPSQTIQQGGSFSNINLAAFVTDDATASTSLKYALENASENLSLSITAGVLSIEVKNGDWLGSETIKISATDEDGASSIVSIILAVEELKVDLKSVAFSQSSIAVAQDKKIDLATYVTYQPENATIESMVWSVSDKDVAAINGVGVLTNLLDYGTETVVATVVVTDKSGNEYTKNISIVLTGCPTAISVVTLENSNVDLHYDETAQITYELVPANACVKSVSYSSSDKTIAKVSDNGLITAFSEDGSAIITVTVNDGFSVNTATCTVTVSKDCSGDIELSLNKPTMALLTNANEKLLATITPDNECTADNEVVWTTSNASVATVSNGVVSGVSEGTAIITATTTGSGVTTATCVVTVSSDCESGPVSMEMSSTNETMYMSDVLTLTAEITTDNPCNNTIVWSSSDETVATVEDGVVTPLQYGDVVIRATAKQDAGSYVECNVSVVKKEVTAVELTPQAKMMYVGATQTMTVKVTPEDADDKTITWLSSDPEIAKVSNKGVVTALASGTVTIYAIAASSVSDHYSIQVVDVEVQNISLNISKVTLTTGDNQQVSVSYEPENATNKSLVWTSTDETIATVSEDGVITAVGEGTTTIVVKTLSGISKIITVTVQSDVIAVENVSVAPTSLVMNAGDTKTVVATVSPADATNKTISWTSSDENVVTVSSEGIVTAVGAGTAEVTASSANGKTATVDVTVNYKKISSVSLAEKTITLNEGENSDLSSLLNLSPVTVETESIVWSINSSNATIDEDGLLVNNRLFGTEQATVTVTVTDMYGTKKTATMFVTLNGCQQKITSVAVNTNEVEISASESASLSVEIAPKDACLESITYTSADKTVAIVSSTGKISAVSEGETTITIAVSDGFTTIEKTVAVSVLKDVVAVTAVSFEQTSYVKYIGDEFTLNATVYPLDATNQSLVWSSSDKSVATVSEDGLITILAAGKATITAKANNGVSASCLITAKAIDVTAVALSQSTLTIQVYDSEQLTATVTPSNATDKSIVWSSSNEVVASVDENGIVTANKSGSCSIMATSANGKTKSCTVVVTDIEPTSITVSATSVNLNIDEKKTITTTLSPENVTDTDLTWSSNNTTVAIVENGVIQAVGTGSTKVIVTTGNGLRKEIIVTVNALEATSITLNTDEVTLLQNEQQNLIATVLPEKTTNKMVRWTSSDRTVATVDALGKITAVGIGEAVITAATVNGLKATCKVVVTLNVVAATSVEIIPSQLTMYVGDITPVEAQISPANTTNKSIVWSSDKISVATVDQYGSISAVSAGTATIKATSSNNLVGTCVVTVKEIEVTSVSIPAVSLAVGEYQVLSAVCLPANATDKTITWTVANTSIATITSSGKITGVAEGTTKVMAMTSNGVIGIATVTVSETAIPVKSIMARGNSFMMNIGNSVELASLVTFNPTNATNKSLTAVVTNNVPDYDESASVVSISNGVITALAAGSADLLITSASTGVTTTTSVIVNPIAPQSVVLNKTSLELVVNGKEKLEATILPINASNTSVKWESANPAVATITQDGIVYAVGVGSTFVTVRSKINSSISERCYVTVIETPVSKITPSVSSLNMNVGFMKSIKLTIEPEEASASAITWTSSDSKVAVVDNNGLVEAVGLGKVVITATASNGVSCAIVCEVTEPNVAPQVIARIPNQTLSVGSSVSIDLTEYFFDEDALLYSIDDMGSNISCSVSSDGKATFSVKDEYGLGGEQIVEIYAKDPFGLRATTQIVFTVDGIKTKPDTNPSAVDEVETFVQTMDVYPTPTTGPITVVYELQFAESSVIEIYSAMGLKVAERAIKDSDSVEETFDLFDLKAGVYFVIVTTKDGRVQRSVVKR
ncbi:MAG: Ig-like domain-containing protein [Bacteroidales bacterium]|nr:Ig-like domain-containing protein [Bacteroidales bacterium]